MKTPAIILFTLITSISGFSALSPSEEVVCGVVSRPNDGDTFLIKDGSNEYTIPYLDDNVTDNLVHSLGSEYCVRGIIGKDKKIKVTEDLNVPSEYCGTITDEPTEGQLQYWLDAEIENDTSVKAYVLITDSGNSKRDNAHQSRIENVEDYEERICVKGPEMEDPLDSRPTGSRRHAMIVYSIN